MVGGPLSSRARLALGVVVAFCLLLGPALAQAQATPIALGACSANQVDISVSGLQCGTVAVPLDWTNPALGTINLAVQSVPAIGPQVGTLLLLAGGPGQAALAPFESLVSEFRAQPELNGFQLVSFDQRGTGQSGALSCPTARTLTECGDSLGSAIGDYTTQDSVYDLDTVRQALGVQQLTLLSVSYGGRVAGTYALEFPNNVARNVMDSPVPLTGINPIDAQLESSLQRVLNTSLCGDGACKYITSNLYRDLTRLVHALQKHSLDAHILGIGGHPTTQAITETDVFSLVMDMDLVPGLEALMPSAITSAARGNPTELGNIVAVASESPETSDLAAAREVGPAGGYVTGPGSAIPASEDGISSVLELATDCVENNLPWAPNAPVDSRFGTFEAWLEEQPDSEIAPFSSEAVVPNTLAESCLEWPPSASAPPAPTGVSAVPTLILAGDLDLRVPYEQDLTVATGYSDVQVLRIADTGHSTITADPTGCAFDAMAEFVASGQAPGGCAAPTARLVLTYPATLAGIRPLSASRVTRAMTAVGDTIRAVRDIGGSSGGFYGGYWTLSKTGTDFYLHGVVDVQSVTVSGVMNAEGNGRLTVRGAVSGTVGITAGTALTGKLDGQSAKLTIL